jgi:hypothetical protein
MLAPCTAAAATRYASPSGGLAPDCSQLTPCSLENAIEGAAPGDEVVVLPGTYTVASTIETETPLWIHGQEGPERPRIFAANQAVLKSFAPQRIGNLSLEAVNSGLGVLFVPANGSVFERLEVWARGADALGLRIGNNFTLTDSVVWAGESPNSVGLFLQGTAPGAPQLRNDTIVGVGSESIGIALFITAPSTSIAIKATNVIAIGDTDASAQVGSEATGSTAAIDFDHSNLDTSVGNVTSTNGQTAQPLFFPTNPLTLQEAPDSPTIDAGVNDPANGPLDLAGSPRALPRALTCTGPDPAAITDIGAYEFVPTPLGCVPQTTITKLKLRKRRAKVRFSATGTKEPVSFKCRLDKRRWRPCRSPKIYKHMKVGRHVVKVRAFAGAQNDPTPAKRRFRVRP